MAYLTAVNGKSKGTRYELDKPTCILGRYPDCDVVLDSPPVSRRHARISKVSDAFLLEDLKSRSGTFLNSRQIVEATTLADGDLFRICDFDLSFHSDNALKPIDSTVIKDGSWVMMVDDPDDSSSVTSKIDVRSGAGGSHWTTSAEVRLAAVLEIVKGLGKALVLDEVFPKVLESLFRIFVQADRGFIVLLDESGELKLQCANTRQVDSQETIRISKTVIRLAMESRQALISLDATSDERFGSAESISDVRIRSMIVAPLLGSDGEPLGAIQMDTLNNLRRFEESDLEILIAVTAIVSVATENAQFQAQRDKQKQLEQDLELAKHVQRAYLPSRHPELSGYSFYHFYRPAEKIGGDYFDYIPLPDGRMAIVVADVAGHGVSAAMLMAKLSAETRFALASTPLVDQAINRLNSQIAALGVEKFITFLCLVLDPQSGNIQFVNAAHMAPLWRRQDSKIEQPGQDEGGGVLGFFDNVEYNLSSMTLLPGEKLLLYTDGINEAPNATGTSCFGIPTLQKLLAASAGDVSQIGKSITDAVFKHIEGTNQEDDMCLLIFGRDEEPR